MRLLRDSAAVAAMALACGAVAIKAGDLGRGSRAKQPNFVWIMADDLGWGEVGSYPGGSHGGVSIATPNLDKLFVEEGLSFSNAYAGYTVWLVRSPTRLGAGSAPPDLPFPSTHFASSLLPWSRLVSSPLTCAAVPSPSLSSSPPPPPPPPPPPHRLQGLRSFPHHALHRQALWPVCQARAQGDDHHGGAGRGDTCFHPGRCWV